MKGENMSALTRARERWDAVTSAAVDEADRLYAEMVAEDATVQSKAAAKERLAALHEREARRHRQQGEVEAAYSIISTALNAGRKDDVLLALAGEHSTLLGQLWNVVTDVAEERQHDGRVERIHEIVQGRRNPYI
jgi:adenine-specific DNA methylase